MFTLKNILHNNGVTLAKTGDPISYPRGYQVSTQDMEIIPTYKLRKKHLMELLHTIPENACLGVWIETGKAYIDQSSYFNRKRQAVQAGKKYRQRSIWDWKTAEAVYL